MNNAHGKVLISYPIVLDRIKDCILSKEIIGREENWFQPNELDSRKAIWRIRTTALLSANFYFFSAIRDVKITRERLDVYAYSTLRKIGCLFHWFSGYIEFVHVVASRIRRRLWRALGSRFLNRIFHSCQSLTGPMNWCHICLKRINTDLSVA